MEVAGVPAVGNTGLGLNVIVTPATLVELVKATLEWNPLMAETLTVVAAEEPFSTVRLLTVVESA